MAFQRSEAAGAARWTAKGKSAGATLYPAQPRLSRYLCGERTYGEVEPVEVAEVHKHEY